MTHTFARLPVTLETYYEIHTKFDKARFIIWVEGQLPDMTLDHLTQATEIMTGMIPDTWEQQR